MTYRLVKRNVLILFLLAIIIAGVVIFVKLAKNKKTLEENLYTHIPVSISSILQINDAKSIDRLLSSEKRLTSVVKSLESYFIFPFLFVEYKNNPYFIAKVSDDDVTLIEQKLQTDLFPYYQAKEVRYKDTEFYLYATSESDFFVYMSYEGFIVGGFNTNFFRAILDTDINSNLVIANSPMSRGLLDYMKRHYPANLFLNNSSCFSVFNIDFNVNKIELEGYGTDILENNWVCREKGKSVAIDYSVFPDSLVYYNIDMYNPIISDSLRCFFEPPSYTFKMPNQTKNVFALKYDADKAEMYDILSDLEAGFTGKRLSVDELYNGHKIYKSSLGLSVEIFKSNQHSYLVFYKDFVIYSEDKDVVKSYIRQNGKYKTGDDFIEKDVQDLISISYTDNINKWYPEIFSAANPISSQNKRANIISFIENGKYKTKIYINN